MVITELTKIMWAPNIGIDFTVITEYIDFMVITKRTDLTVPTSQDTDD